MPDLKKLAYSILKDKKTEATHDAIENLIIELEKSLTGRKVQILVFLEKVQRMNSFELSSAMGLKSSSNLSVHANRLRDNLLIRKYDGSEFMSGETLDMRVHYHSITAYGSELIADLGNK